MKSFLTLERYLPDTWARGTLLSIDTITSSLIVQVDGNQVILSLLAGRRNFIPLVAGSARIKCKDGDYLASYEMSLIPTPIDQIRFLHSLAYRPTRSIFIPIVIRRMIAKFI